MGISFRPRVFQANLIHQGLNLHLLTSVALISLQTLVLRVPGVRAKFKLPLLSTVKAPQPSMKETFSYVRESLKRRMIEQAAVNAEREKRMKMVMKK